MKTRKMPVPKEDRRILNRLTAGMPPITRLMRQFARLGWMAAAQRYPEHACPVKEGMLRNYWLLGHRYWEKGIGPMHDEKPPLRKVKPKSRTT